MTGSDETTGPSGGGPGGERSLPRRDLHGRRHGRRLRPGLKQLLLDALPKVRIELPALGGRLDPAGLFPRPPAEIWLEIGFGGGEHLAWQAGEQARLGSRVGLLGVEFFINGIAMLLRDLAAQDALERVRVHQGDGREIIEALADASVARAFVLFPDPWPKARHHKRRLIQRQTLDGLARILCDGAELRLASDDHDYLAWMLRLLGDHPAFRWTAERAEDWRRRPPDWPETRYGRKAVEAGRSCVFLSYRRLARSAGRA